MSLLWHPPCPHLPWTVAPTHPPAPQQSLPHRTLPHLPTPASSPAMPGSGTWTSRSQGPVFAAPSSLPAVHLLDPNSLQSSHLYKGAVGEGVHIGGCKGPWQKRGPCLLESPCDNVASPAQALLAPQFPPRPETTLTPSTHTPSSTSVLGPSLPPTFLISCQALQPNPAAGTPAPSLLPHPTQELGLAMSLQAVAHI